MSLGTMLESDSDTKLLCNADSGKNVVRAVCVDLSEGIAFDKRQKCFQLGVIFRTVKILRRAYFCRSCP